MSNSPSSQPRTMAAAAASGVMSAGMVKSLRAVRAWPQTGVHHAHAHAQCVQIQVQRLGRVDEGRLGGAVGQALGQAAKARHAADQAHMPRPPHLGRCHHGGQHGWQQAQGAGVVHVFVAQGFGQVEVGGAHVAVVARAVAHQVSGPPASTCCAAALTWAVWAVSSGTATLPGCSSTNACRACALRADTMTCAPAHTAAPPWPGQCRWRRPP